MSKENTRLDVWAKKGYIMVDGKLVKSETLVAKKVDKINIDFIPQKTQPAFDIAQLNQQIAQIAFNKKIIS